MPSELGPGTPQLDTAVVPGKCYNHQGGKVTAGDRAGTGRSKKQQVFVPPAWHSPTIFCFGKICGRTCGSQPGSTEKPSMALCCCPGNMIPALPTDSKICKCSSPECEMVWYWVITPNVLPRTPNPPWMLSSAWGCVDAVMRLLEGAV